MPLTLNADGRKTVGPGATDIAHAFESLERGPGIGPGISIIMLQCDEAHMLTATGTYTEGFFLGHNDGDPEYEYVTDMHQPISPDDIIKIFQAYAGGEDWGQSKFKWEVNDTRESMAWKIISRVLVGGFICYFIYVIIRQILK